jgi:methylenetetrahydrofolate reductase (NADPH)
MQNIRVFRDDIEDPDHFVITLELVPKAESRGRSVETVMGIAQAAYEDGRVSAVSVTDNPGGNPSLSPDVLGYEIFKLGMDVIIHFTCRDMNRVGMESRALQLDLMGMKNILALTGDYSGPGFGGQGAPVFDMDSVNLTCALTMLNDRLSRDGDPEGFFTGCAVSPFKQTEGETVAQYAKMCKKIAAGARFLITQLGYDARKFQELIQMQKRMGVHTPTMASLYVLSPVTARIMHSGKIPGAVVTRRLLDQVKREWTDPEAGRAAAVERAARLAVILKGLGYRGIHIGGIHKDFEPVARILDRMEEIAPRWREFVPEFDFPQKDGFYFFEKGAAGGLSQDIMKGLGGCTSRCDRGMYHLMAGMHHLLFSFDSPIAGSLQRLCARLDGRRSGKLMLDLVEDPVKQMLLACKRCGDCGIQHVAFLCPESQCPKHMRNGACGGSLDGMCEVDKDRACIWYRAYHRLASVGKTAEMTRGCVPPRMWELNGTSSWINFHLGRDHQSQFTAIGRYCGMAACTLDDILSVTE